MKSVRGNVQNEHCYFVLIFCQAFFQKLWLEAFERQFNLSKQIKYKICIHYPSLGYEPKNGRSVLPPNLLTKLVKSIFCTLQKEVNWVKDHVPTEELHEKAPTMKCILISEIRFNHILIKGIYSKTCISFGRKFSQS